MIISDNITPERLMEIKNFPITYDEDCPKLTKEQLARMKPRNQEAGQSGAARLPRSLRALPANSMPLELGISVKPD